MAKKTNQQRVIKSEEFDPNAPTDVKSEMEKESRVNDDIGYYVIEGLPTGGKLYPEGTVIKARPLKVLEVKKLANMNEENADDVVNEVLRLTVKGIEIEDIYSTDKLYIIFWLRANTYKDSGYKVSFNCPKCKKDASYDFDLDSLNVKDLTEKNINQMKQEVTLPVTGNKITFKFLKIKDEQSNLRFLKNNKRSMMNFDEEILAICKMIDTVDGEAKGMLDKYMFLTEDITPPDYSFIESHLQDVSVGLEPMIDVKCDNCGGSAETALPFRSDFFLPKATT